jgi:hypothetical protein
MLEEQMCDMFGPDESDDEADDFCMHEEFEKENSAAPGYCSLCRLRVDKHCAVQIATQMQSHLSQRSRVNGNACKVK